MNTVEALAASIVCRYIEDDDVEFIHAAGTISELAAGKTLFCEGDPGGSLFVILSGKLQIWKKAGPSDLLLLATLGPGEILGEISLVDISPRSALATAETAATLFELNRRDVMNLLRSRPVAAGRILWAILETLSLRLRDMNAEVVRWNVDQARDLPNADI